MIRVLLVDDEALVRRGLRICLGAETDVEIVGEARDGDDAVRKIRALTPDLVFLDVQMPERDGFAVLDAFDPDERPAVVFVTAFDDYAVRAFGVHAVDYLVKPFDDVRFAQAMQRARSRLHARHHAPIDDRTLAALLRAIRTDVRTAEPLERLLVKTRDRTIVISVDDVDCFEAADNYVRLHLSGAKPDTMSAPLIRETLATLSARLDPARFARAHRSAIVRLGAVRALEPLFHGDQAVVLRSGARITLGRAFREEFEQRLTQR